VKKDELTKFDGKEGQKSYVSYKGKVYDVTDSRLWKNGKHVNKHHAGMDLTEAMEAAPHGPEVLERFKHIGDVDGFKPKKEDISFKGKVRHWYKILHPHPMFIHFPMGMINFTVFMQILFFITGNKSFESAGFYSLATAVLFMFPTIFSGMVSWWVNYALTRNKIFLMKLNFSIILLVMGLIEVSLRFSYPDISYAGSGMSSFYNIMLFANVPVLGVIGFYGGKLSWG
jgi:predicted heme/steroid binding protein/uncharacterized membrane protein